MYDQRLPSLSKTESSSSSSFSPVSQHDPISVRVQAVSARVVQTGEWLLVNLAFLLSV